MPTKMLDAGTLATMTGPAIVAHFNQLVEENPELGYKAVNRFASLEAAQRRLAALYSSIRGAAADDGRTHEPPATEPHVVSSTGVDVAVPGIPAAQRSEHSTPGSRARFIKAYDRAGSQETQDLLHEDQFLEEPKTARQAATTAPKEEQPMGARKKVGAKAGRKTNGTTAAASRGFAPEAKIQILVAENPRRGAAAERFKIYRNGMTVAKYCEHFEGGRSEALVHLRWDVKHGHIKVG